MPILPGIRRFLKIDPDAVYPLNRWDSFQVFLQPGSVPMDNNAADWALKYPMIGRKTWLFFGNPTAGEMAASCSL